MNSSNLFADNSNTSDKYLRVLFEQASDFFIHLSPEFKILNLNHAVVQVCGTVGKNYIGESYKELLNLDTQICSLLNNPKKLIDKLKKIYPQPLKQPASILGLHISWIVNLILNEAGEFNGLILIGHNLIDVKLAEQRARDTKFTLETMIAHLPGNVYWMDVNCIHLGCNDNVLKMLGITREQYVGKTYEELAELVGWKNGEGESFKKDDLEVLRSGTPKFNVEEPPIHHKDGRTVYFLTTRVPMKNEAGDIVGVAGISIDITELKQKEAELIKAKENAEIAVEAKSQFLANMSHDFITPLSIIMNAAEAVQMALGDTDKCTEYCNDIKITASTLLNYVQDILEVSQFDCQAMPVKQELLDLWELATETLKVFTVHANKKGLKINMEYPDNMVHQIVSDKHRVRRIINNLMANAIKFTNSGHVDLKFSVAPGNNDNNLQLHFEVADTGIGIPKEKLYQVFERFTRLDPSYHGHYKGLGLGLHIAQEFAQQLGGRINVDSKEGRGSVFSCEIICGKAESISSESVQSLNKSIAKPLEQKIILSHLKLLLVEDEPLIQKFTQLILAEFQCQITLANNAADAIKLATSNVYDLILLDVGLPDHDGLYVAKKIREHESIMQLSPILIVALTAHIDLDKKADCLQAGMNEFCNKPLTKERFLQICEKNNLLSK